MRWVIRFSKLSVASLLTGHIRHHRIDGGAPRHLKSQPSNRDSSKDLLAPNGPIGRGIDPEISSQPPNGDVGKKSPK